MHHDLKIDKPYLEAKLAGDKLFEIRNNDRGYQKGDTVSYYENKPLQRMKHTYEITYVSNYCQRDNNVVFGERHIESVQDD
jgi:hypothetical protein